MTRPVRIDTPLGETLLFKSLVGREEIGRLFELELELFSEEDSVDFTKVVAQPMTVFIETSQGVVRHLSGICTRFAHGGTQGRYVRYRATLRPWLWLLTKRSNCRIFQNKTAPDIIKEIFREHGLTDFSESLSRTYRTRDYCVQYRETDFDFVSRLMEEEGIYYFFEHEPDKHTLVLADSYSAHQAAPGYGEVPYYPRTTRSVRRERDHIDEWAASEELESGAYFLEDFDFLRPKANLEVKLASQHELARKSLEIYDYPGSYEQSSDGETYVRLRLEERYARQALAIGEGNARGIAPGALLKLTNFPRADQNKEYLVVSAEYDFSSDSYESSAESEGEIFRVSFSAIDSQRPYRSEALTPRPIVRGPQTAIVVGKEGEEIWTDEHGRVKLQFHWDRQETASCWVRVAQYWAGGAWGSIHIPRIGQEVIVEFLEGDPDRPIVTGRVYNGDMKPPYELPANQTQSGIKSRSTKEGNEENFNEIRFEDKKGEEHVFIQAEKDLQVLVKNDAQHEIRANESTSIGGNRTETVEKDESITIKGARTETVEKDETLTVNGSRTRTVAKDESISIDGGLTVTVTKDHTVDITGKQTLTVNKDQQVSINGEQKTSIGKSNTMTIGKKMVVEVADELVLKVGSATVTMKKNGDITIKGKNLTLDGSKVAVKSSGTVAISGSSIAQN